MNHAKLRNMQYVRRFNFHSCVRYQNVAEHSYYVALYAQAIAKRVFISYSEPVQRNFVASVVSMALKHDMAEAVTGDIPYLVRKHMDREELQRIEHVAYTELDVDYDYEYDDPLVYAIVALADAIELKVYCQEERNRGNQNLWTIEKETQGRIERSLEDPQISIPGEIWAMLEDVGSRSEPDFLSH